MGDFSNRELANMHFCYGLADGNGLRARRFYQERFPDLPVPHHEKFQKIHQQLCDKGEFYKREKNLPSRNRPVRTPEIEEQVLHEVENNQSTSTRKIAQRLEISHQTVWKILHDQQLYPFRLQKVQKLLPGDLPRRLDFCNWMLHQNEHFFRKIFFTDECCFSKEGMFNSHNSHLWDDEQPHGTFSRNHQHRFSVNVWCGIIGDTLVGPYFIDGRLTGEKYAEILRDHLDNLLEDVPLRDRRGMWFMHDGAPPHTARIVSQILNDKFGNNWIANNGPILWPARSPDLNPLDFYLWGHLKELVYEHPVENLVQLRDRIINSCNYIRNNYHNSFPRVRQSLRRRCELCIAVEGRHFECFL